MKQKNVTLHLDGQLYEKYRKHCKEKGLLVSRQIEIFIESQLKGEKNGK
jgi:hypothetical protein